MNQNNKTFEIDEIAKIKKKQYNIKHHHNSLITYEIIKHGNKRTKGLPVAFVAPHHTQQLLSSLSNLLK